MARGSKRRRGDAWQLRVHVGDGRYVSKTVRGTEREADRHLRRFVDEHDRPDARPNTNMTVREWFDEWISAREAGGLAPATIRGYVSKIETCIVPSIGSVPLDRVAAGDVERVLRHMADRGLSVASRRQAYAIMRRAFQDATVRGYAFSNPTQHLRGPSVRWRPPALPDTTAVPRILAAAAEVSQTAEVLVRLALATGARRGELVALRWGDIRPDAIFVGRSLTRDHSRRLVAKPTKTHAQALIDIDGNTTEAVGAHRRRMAERAAALGASLTDDCWVFSDDPPSRVPHDPDWATRIWVRVRAGAGVELPFKDLRHLSATYLLASGIPAHEVAARLRHASPQTTLRYYAARTSPVRDQTREALGRLFAGD